MNKYYLILIPIVLIAGTYFKRLLDSAPMSQAQLSSRPAIDNNVKEKNAIIHQLQVEKARKLSSRSRQLGIHSSPIEKNILKLKVQALKQRCRAGDLDAMAKTESNRNKKSFLFTLESLLNKKVYMKKRVSLKQLNRGFSTLYKLKNKTKDVIGIFICHDSKQNSSRCYKKSLRKLYDVERKNYAKNMEKSDKLHFFQSIVVNGDRWHSVPGDRFGGDYVEAFEDHMEELVGIKKFPSKRVHLFTKQLGALPIENRENYITLTLPGNDYSCL